VIAPPPAPSAVEVPAPAPVPIIQPSPYRAERPPSGLPCEGERKSIANVNVYYATNRKRSGSPRADAFYGADNADALEFGMVRVTIPPNHVCGHIDSPELTDLRFARDEKRDMVLKEVRPLARNVYFASIAQKVARSEGHELFVFIHGFNNTFEDAALRAAELTFDLDFQGAPILYSWPARGGGALGAPFYFRDQHVARASAKHLRIFLNLLARQTGAETIHVIAHSMGNYVLESALSDEDGHPRPIPSLTPKLHEILLAAADIGLPEVRALAAALHPDPAAPRPHLTLYASNHDEALKLSREVNGRVPVGLIVDSVPSVPGVDVVDASSLTSDIIGHAYFAADPASLKEIHALILNEWEKAKREWIAPKEGYWYFCGNMCPLHRAP
jgi:esterase/lipase superfamily enzyme